MMMIMVMMLLLLSFTVDRKFHVSLKLRSGEFNLAFNTIQMFNQSFLFTSGRLGTKRKVKERER